MWYSSDIEVNRLDICLDLVLKIVEHFKGGFATDGIEVSLLENGVLVTNSACHGE